MERRGGRPDLQTGEAKEKIGRTRSVERFDHPARRRPIEAVGYKLKIDDSTQPETLKKQIAFIPDAEGHVKWPGAPQTAPAPPGIRDSDFDLLDGQVHPAHKLEVLRAASGSATGWRLPERAAAARPAPEVERRDLDFKTDLLGQGADEKSGELIHALAVERRHPEDLDKVVQTKVDPFEALAVYFSIKLCAPGKIQSPRPAIR
jgi:hypothetical protein